jgi:N-acetylglutamate synthase-like GNAT family acetyltransferase
MSDVAVRPLTLDDIPACEQLLAGLPNWFGIREANEQYIRDLAVLPSFVATIDGEIAGFATIHHHNPDAAELHIIAVDRERHRTGIGRLLLERVQQEARHAGARLLQVKTLGPSNPDEGYARTRQFYLAMGFIPLEETTAFWGEGQPTLIMVKPLTTPGS